MPKLVYRRATLTFALLSLITVLSYWFTVGHGSSLAHASEPTVWTVVMILTYIKVRWVMLDFMELRGSRVGLRMVFECVALVMATSLIAINWLVA
ncbi:cytochrome C oxidase subunit IV family protein [Mycolicibacterium sp. XJ1819]